jgi:hypothetical protein
METEVQERFERIERNLERASERIVEITTAHLELETAQVNSQKRLDRVDATLQNVGDKIANLTILVDRLIERDLGRT